MSRTLTLKFTIFILFCADECTVINAKNNQVVIFSSGLRYCYCLRTPDNSQSFIDQNNCHDCPAGTTYDASIMGCSLRNNFQCTAGIYLSSHFFHLLMKVLIHVAEWLMHWNYIFFKKIKLMEYGAIGKHKVSVQIHVVQLDSKNTPELVLVHNLVVNSVLVLV